MMKSEKTTQRNNKEIYAEKRKDRNRTEGYL